MVSVFDLLEAEWNRLGRNRSAAAQLGDVRQLAGDAATLADVEQFVRGAGPVEADRVLVALVARAVRGEALAARVLLQLLLPGTRKLARRWWAIGDHEERAAAAVMAVYSRIRRYPLARRPARVAANILMDAAHELRRSVPRVPLTSSRDSELARRREPGPALAADPHPSEELSEVLCDAVAAGIVGRDDAELIARSRIAGHRVADLAVHRGLRPRTLWDRRQRAELALVTAHAAAPAAGR